MKRNLLLVLILCVILALGACGARAVVDTAAGKFETSQDTMAVINDSQGNELTASPGNTLLVIYMTPADDNKVTEDEAYAFFYSGSKALIGDSVYDMKCISLEKSGAKVRYGLVFDIADNGYTDQNMPDAKLQLPTSMPQPTPEPTATPLPTVVVTPDPASAPSESEEVSPTES